MKRGSKDTLSSEEDCVSIMCYVANWDIVYCINTISPDLSSPFDYSLLALPALVVALMFEDSSHFE